MKRINQAWIKGLDPAEQKKMEENVLSSEILLDRLAKILYNMQEKRESVTGLEHYDTPSWSHKQAHLNGEAAALKKVLEIITVKERDDNPFKQQGA